MCLQDNIIKSIILIPSLLFGQNISESNMDSIQVNKINFDSQVYKNILPDSITDTTTETKEAGIEQHETVPKINGYRD